MAALCCKPCEYFGKACGTCVDEGCKCCCAMCTKPCELLHSFCCPTNRPSPIFLTFSAIVCGLPMIAAVVGLASGASEPCDQPMVTYLGVSIVLNLLLIAFAVHLYLAFCKPYTGGPHDSSPMSRGSHMFCYDPIVFCFFLVFGGFSVMTILGSIWNGTSKVCDETITSSTSTATAFGYAYFLGGGIVLSFSWCIECGRHKTSGHQLPTHMGHTQNGSNVVRVHKQSMIERLFFPRPIPVVAVPQPQPQAQNVQANVPASAPPPVNPAALQSVGSFGPGGVPIVHATPVSPHNNNANANVPPAYVNHQQTEAEKLKAAANQAAQYGANALRFGANMFGGHQNQQQNRR
mmetsp:Transcript_13366/g.26353  ORF Transcript_13366/g.26353 Transcript_13366/m.26353 type:complete len:348 (-) Transcript_13366:359-1402(-)|eukprot:CAMPEP_0173393628 /NCGR_PEP_ID=MMETSP1356-20130122/22222_1 /TAXON_ID=77927 ORGANISM="Hemiselmis virescens, Strain PCC157" /NCGR_SAMPLE_ID=MMETSP1356 /ASSEMBLY_ACC=CAM_ASM_000847 /LENGTH=347 /DNA_ID=CAMNT_0014351683 /DNA_START=67 /DNA_END=1110 /DNA_ORIENTATION=-